MTTSRRRRRPELSRARSRTLLFAVLVAACLALDNQEGAAVAALGLVAGAYSVSVARRRGTALAHTFVVTDWLLLGLCLAPGGGVNGWLMLAIPLLALAELLPSDRSEWPFLVVPSLLTAIVLAIDDPSLGGDRPEGLVRLAALVTLGVFAAALLQRRPRRQAQPMPNVDPATGFYTRRRLHDLLALRMDEALAAHEPLGVVCLRLDHFRDSTDFYGRAPAEAIAGAVARRVARLLAPEDLAFRPAPDVLVFALPGRSASKTREFAVRAGHEATAGLIGHHRQTLSAGCACFPATRSLEDLLAQAFIEATQCEAPLSAYEADLAGTGAPERAPVQPAADGSAAIAALA